jgi:putative transposase
MSHYRFIDQYRLRYPVRRLCQVLAVPPSRYYGGQQRQQQAGEPQEPAWEVALDQTFETHKKRYGTRRLRVALCQQGHHVGRQALRTAMRRRGLRALHPKAYMPRTTDSTHGLRCAPNRLLDQPPIMQANRV